MLICSNTTCFSLKHYIIEQNYLVSGYSKGLKKALVWMNIINYTDELTGAIKY